jgi:hypothetical protein
VSAPARQEFKRKLVQLRGASLSNKRITVHILDDVNGSIQKRTFMLLTTNLLGPPGLAGYRR